MKSLLKYIKEYRKEALLGPAFKLTEALFELFVPLVVASIIDKGIKNADTSYIIKCGLLMVALGIIGFLCATLAQFFAAKASVGFAANLRSAIFSKIQKLSFTDLDKIGTSTLITRITSDVNQIQTGTNLALRLLLRSPFIVFGAVIMAFTVDPKTSTIFIITTLLLAIIVCTIMAITIPMHSKVQQILEKIVLTTRENLLGIRVIRAFRREQKETDSFNENNENLNTAQTKVGAISALMNPLTYVVVNLGIIGIVWIGSGRVFDGIILSGSVLALYKYMSQILVELIKLANMLITVNKSLACCSRVSAILDMPEIEHNADNKSTADGHIVFSNVSFKYDGASENSLSNLNFEIKKGETFGIIGATGSGKTTLINLLRGFYPATEGFISIDSKNVLNIEKNELARRIGFARQKSVLFKGTIRENLLLGGKTATDEELVLALEAAQALDIVNKKGGLDALIEQGGRNLSGGQKQRLSIARALVGNPNVLILDDSASALDFATEAALRKAIANLKNNPTVITVSQRVSTVMHADRILVLDDGEPISIGTHAELLASCPLYKEIADTQLSGGDR